MTLTVVVQMDPIQHIKIAGDSTFALLLEAQARGHALLHYTPDRLSFRDGRVTASCRTGARCGCRDVEGAHATLGAPERIDLATGRGADAPGSALRHGLHHGDASFGAHSSPNARRQRPGERPQRARKGVRDAIPAVDAADAHHPRQGGDRSVPGRSSARSSLKPLHGHGGAAVLRVTRQDQLRPAVRSLLHELASNGSCSSSPPSLKATSASFWWRARRWGRSTAPAANDIRSNMVRGGAAAATELTARARDLRNHRAGVGSAAASSSSASTGLMDF